MAKDINLLPDITLQEEKQERTRRLLTLISMSVLVLGMVGVVVVFAIQITMDRQYQAIIKTNKELENDIKNYVEVELNQRDLKSKLTAIDTIRKESKDFEFLLKKLQDVTPEGVSFTDISITKENIMSITGTVNTTSNLNVFVGKLLEVQLETKSVFQDISITSLARNETENYQFTITSTVTPKQEVK